jgi:hypothetical protein
MATGKLCGKYHTWNVCDNKRVFGEVTVPFGDAKLYLMTYRYNALNGRGQQRDIEEPHARKLKGAMEDGSYTPTPASANVEARHKKNLTTKDDGTFVLEVDSDDPLALTDAGHRFESLGRIVREQEEIVKGEATPEAKEKAERWLQQALAAPVTVTIYFDGNPQLDFLALQAGRQVDPAHLLSMSIQRNLNKDPSFKAAFEVAKLLHKTPESPFHNLVRFDSKKKTSGSLLSLMPISTLFQKGSSDIATSLLGLARVGLSGDKAFTNEAMAHGVIEITKVLAKDAKELLEAGKVLTPPRDGGTKGSATMLVGLAVCLAYRMKQLGHDVPHEEDLSRLVAAAKQHMNRETAGSFSGPDKRTMLGQFAKSFFADLTCEKHHGIPTQLLRTLSASTFGVEALPKLSKAVQRAETAPPKKTPKKKGETAAASSAPSDGAAEAPAA